MRELVKSNGNSTSLRAESQKRANVFKLINFMLMKIATFLSDIVGFDLTGRAVQRLDGRLGPWSAFGDGGGL